MPQQESIRCRQCGGGMHKTKRVERDFGLQAFGCAIFLVGLLLLFVFPIGTIIGLAMMIGAARMGYKKKPVWKCINSGYFFERT